MKKSKQVVKENKFTFILVLFLILIILIPSLYTTESMDQQLEIRMLGLSVFLVFISVLFVFNKNAIQTNSNLIIFKNPFVIIYIIYTLLILSSVIWATNKPEAIYEGLKRLSFLILFIYLILFIFPKGNYKDAMIKSFILFGILISLNGFLQFYEIISKEGFNLESIYKVTGNYAQKNIFSEVLLFSFAFSLAGIFTQKKIWKSLAIISGILSILLIVLLMTRAIWAGMGIAAIITSIIYFYYTKDNNSFKTHNFRALYIIIIVFILSIASVFILDKNNTIIKQIKNATNFKEGNTYHRLNLWNKTLDLSKKNPMFGVGAGNWRIEILQYDLQVYTAQGRIMPDRTHNDFLQLLAENGITALILFILSLILLIYFSLSIIKYNENLTDKLFILVCLFALIAYHIDSMFAFPKERIELQIFIHMVYAIIVYEYLKIKKQKLNINKHDKKIITAIIAFSLIVSTLTTYAAYKRMDAEKGVIDIYKYHSTGNHNNIIKKVDEIYSAFFTITPFGDPLMDIKATSMFSMKYDNDEVFKTFDKSLKDSPYHLKTYQDMAVVYLNTNNYDKAMEICKKSFSFSPNDAKTQIIIAKIYLNQNNFDSAFNVLKNIELSYDIKTKKEFNQMILFVLRKKISDLASLTKNIEFLINLDLIYKNDEQIIKIFQKSKTNNKSFEKIILKRILSLCKKEKIENDASIKFLKEKYSL